MKYLPLSPDDNLFYEAWGYTNDQRFVEVFQRVWRQIPKKCREKLVTFWSSTVVVDSVEDLSDTNQPRSDTRSPRIVVWQTHLHRNGESDPYPVAQCERLGTAIYFRSNWIDIMSDDMLANLIAHELGHSYLVAVNGVDYWNEENDLVQESDVADLLLWWDFSQEDLDKWTDENRHEFACINCGDEIIAPIGSWEWCRTCGREYTITTDKQVVPVENNS